MQDQQPDSSVFGTEIFNLSLLSSVPEFDE